LFEPLNGWFLQMAGGRVGECSIRIWGIEVGHVLIMALLQLLDPCSHTEFSEFAELDADVSVHRTKLEAIQQSFQAASMASDCDPRVAPT